MADNMERRLCTRHKRVDVFLLPTGKQLHVVAEMQDEVHCLRIDLIVNRPSLRICAITCDMKSVPDEICRNAGNFFDGLIDRRVAPGLLRELRQEASQGCTHLTDLFHDACHNLITAQDVIGREELAAVFPDLTEPQLYKVFCLFRPELRNSCVRYADTSAFMESVDNTRLPKKAQRLKSVVPLLKTNTT